MSKRSEIKKILENLSLPQNDKFILRECDFNIAIDEILNIDSKSIKTKMNKWFVSYTGFSIESKNREYGSFIWELGGDINDDGDLDILINEIIEKTKYDEVVILNFHKIQYLK